VIQKNIDSAFQQSDNLEKANNKQLDQYAKLFAPEHMQYKDAQTVSACNLK
jgi:hypothetical protein